LEMGGIRRTAIRMRCEHGERVGCRRHAGIDGTKYADDLADYQEKARNRRFTQLGRPVSKCLEERKHRVTERRGEGSRVKVSSQKGNTRYQQCAGCGHIRAAASSQAAKAGLATAPQGRFSIKLFER
jgi:hypothetical protein